MRSDEVHEPPEEGRGRDDAPREALGRAILGGEPHLTALDVIGETGATVDDARRLWRALGFPEHPHEAAFTSADAEALSRVFRVVESGVIDLDLAVMLTRALGQTMSKLADWEVATLVGRVEELSRGGGDPRSRIDSTLVLLEQVNKPFEELLVYAWRRHLAAAVARTEALGANEEDLHTAVLTCGFADIVGFTALSNELGEQKVGDLAELFESRCSDAVSDLGGRVIKSIGDSVLFVNESPAAAIDTAEGIVRVIGRDPRMPDVRVGLATGSVVMRLGDVFGPPVNLAARLTAVARRNRIIIDQGTAERLPEDEFDTRALPPRPARGFGVIEPMAVRRR